MLYENLFVHMNMFLSGNVNISKIYRDTISLSFIRVAKERCTPQKVNTMPTSVISCTIPRNYLTILNPLPTNLGVHITIPAIAVTTPLIVINISNDSSVARYSHNISKPITSLSICGGGFIYLFPFSIALSELMSSSPG